MLVPTHGKFVSLGVWIDDGQVLRGVKIVTANDELVILMFQISRKRRWSWWQKQVLLQLVLGHVDYAWRLQQSHFYRPLCYGLTHTHLICKSFNNISILVKFWALMCFVHIEFFLTFHSKSIIVAFFILVKSASWRDETSLWSIHVLVPQGVNFTVTSDFCQLSAPRKQKLGESSLSQHQGWRFFKSRYLGKGVE